MFWEIQQSEALFSQCIFQISVWGLELNCKKKNMTTRDQSDVYDRMGSLNYYTIISITELLEKTEYISMH